MFFNSSQHTDDHMRARLRLDPSRLRWHRHALISNLKQRLNLRLPNKEHNPMSVKLLLIDDPRQILELLEHLLIQKAKEDLILKPESAHLLQHISGGLLEVYPV